MKLRFFLIAFVVAACGDTTSNPPTQVNLDRPVDVAFACYGGLRITGGGGDDSANPGQDVVQTAQPPKACDIRSTVTYEIVNGNEVKIPQIPPGQLDLQPQGGEVIPTPFWYGLILQRGPGTVAVARFPTKDTLANVSSSVQVVDMDPLTPGINAISVGEDPIAIITDTVGCSAITANAGSCDLSILDLTTALDEDGHVNTARMDVTNAAGVPIRSKPAAMLAEPKDELIGNYCPSQAPGAPSPVIAKGLAYIAYPSCHLVAGVDLETGKIVSGVQFSDTGVPSILTDFNVTCPDECGVGAKTAGPRPVTIDLEVDERVSSRRLVIGSENSNSIVVVELDATSHPLSISQVAFSGAANLGITDLAVSPVIGAGGESGTVDDSLGRADYQFVYAVATDQTVRVAEIHTFGVECDTQVDPRLLRQGQDAATLGCLAVGDINTPRRRAGARGPGIDLGKDQVPISVEFARADAIRDDQSPSRSPSKLIGHFAYIGSASGETFIVTVDDDDYPDSFFPPEPLHSPVTLAMPHQLRDAIPNRDARAVVPSGIMDPNEGKPLCDAQGFVAPNGAIENGPRMGNNPTKSLQGFIAPEKSTQLPGFRQLVCEGVDSTKTINELQYQAPQEQRDLAFPDLRSLATDEQVSIVWEGSLSVDRVDTAADGPSIRESMLYIDQQGMHLRDQTRPYCDAGVEPFDIVQMRGCDPSLAGTDCPIGYQCYVHPQSPVQGLGACMLKDEAERLAEACKDFLTSIRRYTVVRAETGELLLTTRRHELRTTPLDGCDSDAQCETLGDLAKRSPLSTHPSDQVEKDTVDDRQWVCRADPTRRLHANGSDKRCNMSCDTTAQCALGTVCVGGNEATPDHDGLCMEGVVPPQSCVNAPQRYELRAGESFVFAGSRTGYVHPIIADTNKQCVKAPNASPYLTSRIPLDPPPCDPTANPFSGLLPNGIDYEPNPCSYETQHFENVPLYVPGTCMIAGAGTATDPSSEIRERTAPAIKYRSRGMTFSMVDPYYPGDQSCITDRLGPNGTPLVRIPQVFHGYAIGFREQGGFSPLRFPILPVFPVKMVRGPVETVWVVDEGDFLSTSIQQSSTRGKVFRIEANRPFSVVNTLE